MGLTNLTVDIVPAKIVVFAQRCNISTGFGHNVNKKVSERPKSIISLCNYLNLRMNSLDFS